MRLATEKRTDRELVLASQGGQGGKEGQEALCELFDRYAPLVNKMKHYLREICVRSGVWQEDVLDEYDGDAWEKFVTYVVPGMRMAEVAHLENWTIFIRFYGYLLSLNRGILRRLIREGRAAAESEAAIARKVTRNEKDKRNSSIDLNLLELRGHVDTATLIHREKGREVLWKAIEDLQGELSAEDARLLNMRYKGFAKTAIKKELDIKEKAFNERVLDLKERLNRRIAEHGGKQGFADYRDIMAAFTG